MAAILRRHWGFALNMVLLTVCLLALWAYLAASQRVRAQEQALQTLPQSDATVSKLDPKVEAHVGMLRSALCLQSRDLAAMGCSQAQAASILTALKTWCQQNQGALEQAEKLSRDAAGSLQQAMQKINMGPRDEALIGQLPALQQASALGRQQQQQVIESAATVVLVQLDGSQQAIWQAARSNGDLPDRYHYVPDISSAQRQALAKPMRKHGVDSAVFQQQAAMTLSPNQQAAVAASAGRINQRLEDVSKAEQQMFPTPALPESWQKLPPAAVPANQ